MTHLEVRAQGAWRTHVFPTNSLAVINERAARWRYSVQRQKQKPHGLLGFQVSNSQSHTLFIHYVQVLFVKVIQVFLQLVVNAWLVVGYQ